MLGQRSRGESYDGRGGGGQQRGPGGSRGGVGGLVVVEVGVVGPPGRGGVGGTLGGHHPHSGGRASVRARPSEGNHRSCGGSVR